MRSDVMLWIYVLAGPIVWFVSMEASFALAPLAPQAKLALYLISLAALAITAVAGYFSWTTWRQFSREKQTSDRGPGARRALSMGGIVVSIMFFIVILAQSIPNFLLKGNE